MKITETVVPFTVAGLLLCSAFSVQARTEIQNKGSDTLVNVAQAWAEEYGKYITVWQRQPDGAWKWIADMGASAPPPEAR